MKQGKIQIYTGNGKGKTTAAFGLCFRALGYGFNVQVIQFQKGLRCGEHIEAEKTGLSIIQCNEGRGSGPCSSPCPLILNIKSILANDPPDLLILDEIMAAIRYKCVSLEEIVEILQTKPSATEIVMTGRNAPQELVELADLVTSMEDVKHYFYEGLLARKGIEY